MSLWKPLVFCIYICFPLGKYLTAPQRPPAWNLHQALVKCHVWPGNRNLSSKNWKYDGDIPGKIYNIINIYSIIYIYIGFSQTILMIGIIYNIYIYIPQIYDIWVCLKMVVYLQIVISIGKMRIPKSKSGTPIFRQTNMSKTNQPKWTFHQHRTCVNLHDEHLTGKTRWWKRFRRDLGIWFFQVQLGDMFFLPLNLNSTISIIMYCVIHHPTIQTKWDELAQTTILDL